MKTRVSRWSQVWLPRVTASAPAARISSQMASVMPKPPAAFSPLITTQSSRQRSRRPGRRSITAWRPGRPTMSPRKRRRMAVLLWALGPDEFRFRHDHVEHPVMGLHRNLFDLLNRIGKADGQDRMLRVEGRDG